MNEQFLSFVWQYRLYGVSARLVDGSSFDVESPGQLNQNAGPDFLNARIRIDGTLWAGSVEIHMKASDWHKHHHHNNDAYRNVILHVVYEDDKPVFIGERELPVLALKHVLDERLYMSYLQFVSSAQPVHCANLLHLYDKISAADWLTSLGVARLMRKSEWFGKHMENIANDWKAVAYIAFCRSFGNKVNDDAFEMLALALPWKLARQYFDKQFSLEALFFGQSGLLDTGMHDTYKEELTAEYFFLKRKHNLTSLSAHIWKFMRTRPANFPTIRIAQLAAAIVHFDHFLHLISNADTRLIEKIASTAPSQYWQLHYHFAKTLKRPILHPGKDTAHRIVINGLLPVMTLFGERKADNQLIEMAVEFLSALPAEDNRIIKTWRKCGICPENGLHSQGLLELYNEYCRLKRCLDCRIGLKVLKKVIEL